MGLDIVEVKTRKQLRDFIYLPEKIHKDHKNWVPPIYMDEFGFFNPRKNKSFGYSDTIMLLAYRDGQPVGRIMGIIQKRYNKLHNEHDARFSFMETYEDPEVFNALLEKVENWAREKGCENLVGPLGFSDKDPQGFMIEGFDQPIVIASNANFPYMPRMLEERGYKKKIDLVVYKVPIPEQLPETHLQVYERVMKNMGDKIKIHKFETRKQLKPWIIPILTLLNETFKDIYAFSPFEDYEMEEFAERYIYLLDPEFIYVITDLEDQPIAFIIGMPDISQGVIAARGRLLPFGIFKILRSQKKTKQLNLLLGGIKEEYRGKGLDVILGKLVFEAARRRGFEYIDSHLELENNYRVRREMERMGGKVYKRYRIYYKPLNPEKINDCYEE